MRATAAPIAKHTMIARHGLPNERDAYSLIDDFHPAYEKPKRHVWFARPGTEVTNPATGEITSVPEYFWDEGGSLSVSKLGERIGQGPRKTRATLVSIGMLWSEREVRHVPMQTNPTMTKPEYQRTLRLTEWAVKMRYGRRVASPRGYEFDLLTPSGIAYVDEMLALEKALAEPPVPKIAYSKATDTIKTLLREDPTIRQVDIVRRTGLSKMTVHRAIKALAA